MRKISSYDKAAVGRRLLHVRKALGRTQAQAAEILDISLSHYSKLEIGVGRMSSQLIFTFCSKLGVREAWLLTGDGEWQDKDGAAGRDMREPGGRYRLRAAPAPSGTALDDALLERVVELALAAKTQKLADRLAADLGLTKPRALATVIRAALAKERDA